SSVQMERRSPGPHVSDILKNAPRNWGRWGADDEVGTLNQLGSQSVLAALAAVRTGKTFTLQAVMADPAGDPVTPNRQSAQRFTVRDAGTYLSSKAEPLSGGTCYADDFLATYLHGTTHYDALGHVWANGQLWNGYDAETT